MIRRKPWWNGNRANPGLHGVEMALRVEKAFGIGMDMLLRMQAWYDASRIRTRASEIDVRRCGPA